MGTGQVPLGLASLLPPGTRGQPHLWGRISRLDCPEEGQLIKPRSYRQR